MVDFAKINARRKWHAETAAGRLLQLYSNTLVSETIEGERENWNAKRLREYETTRKGLYEELVAEIQRLQRIEQAVVDELRGPA